MAPQLDPDGTATVAAGEKASTRPDARRRITGPAILVAADVIIVAGTSLGIWFTPFIVGLAIGAAARWRRRRLVAAAALVTVVGWAIPLAWQAVRGLPVAATARTVAALVGLPAWAGLMLAVTLLLGVIEALLGVWLARAVVGTRRYGRPLPKSAPSEQLDEIHVSG
jgi:hypothetical protein